MTRQPYDADSTVTIVLCTWNGARFIDEQIKSLLSQDWPLHIQVHDDASDDGTLERLEHYRDDHRIEIFAHDRNVGHLQNFARGIETALARGARWIALSDQDDRWRAQRIHRGMQAMRQQSVLHGESTPLLVHSDLAMIDDSGRLRQDSYLDYRGFAIDNRRDLPVILGQNGVMGNTVLMNRALAELALPFPTGLHVHDYWIALMAELYGYRTLIRESLVDYRIHDTNSSNPSHRLRPLQSPSALAKMMKGFLERDLALPFLEDQRHLPLLSLLEGDGHRPRPDDRQAAQIIAFIDYLQLKKPRRSLLGSMLTGRYLRQGHLYRLRFAWNLLLTRRYSA